MDGRAGKTFYLTDLYIFLMMTSIRIIVINTEIFAKYWFLAQYYCWLVLYISQNGGFVCSEFLFVFWNVSEDYNNSLDMWVQNTDASIQS